MNMNKTLILSGAILLLTMTGCLVSEEHRHGNYRGRGGHEVYQELCVVTPELVVRPPEIIVREFARAPSNSGPAEQGLAGCQVG